VISNSIPSNAIGSFANDFTTTIAHSYKSADASSDPVILLSGGTRYGLWAGDVNKDRSVNAVDVSAVKVTMANSAASYLFTDCNLDGNVNAADVSLVKVTIAASGSGSTSARISNTKVVSSLPD
jgi:hypothetical protein